MDHILLPQIMKESPPFFSLCYYPLPPNSRGKTSTLKEVNFSDLKGPQKKRPLWLSDSPFFLLVLFLLIGGQLTNDAAVRSLPSHTRGGGSGGGPSENSGSLDAASEAGGGSVCVCVCVLHIRRRTFEAQFGDGWRRQRRRRRRSVSRTWFICRASKAYQSLLFLSPSMIH